METIIRTKIKDLLASEAGKEVLAKGWVRTKRGNKNVAFIALNDGSTINNIQIVVDKTPENEAVLAKVTTGACIAINRAFSIFYDRLSCAVAGGYTFSPLGNPTTP